MASYIGRRKFLATLGGAAAAWPLTARAQQRATTVGQARVGVLAVSPPTPAMLNAFREGMRERGYIEGQNLSIDVRWSQGTFEQISALAAELVSANVQVIIAWATPSAIAARRATSVIPIVMVSVGDPVGSGFVTSLARPGGNITGFSGFTADLSAKLMALFVELVPNIKRVGIVSNSYNPNVSVQLWETEDAVRKLGLQSQVIEARAPEEFERAFARMSVERVNGVVLLADPSVIEQAQKIAELAQAARLPTAFQRRENVEAGGLTSYGGNIQHQFRQAAIHVDRILKGAKPADLPVEQPTKYELVINLKTAKALGLTVPQTLLVAADEVIE
jgi:putative ABC transport system substrate-binding protein